MEPESPAVEGGFLTMTTREFPETVFLISFPDGSLLVFKNATDILKFILYFVTLRNSLIGPNRFLWNL